MLDPLRQRFCSRLECRAMFFICRSCDRGQRYCGNACPAIGSQPTATQRQSPLPAECRRSLQPSSEPARLSKRRAQRRRSDMQNKETVTDQGSAPMLAMAISVRLIVACARLSGFDLSIPPTTKALPVIELSLTCHSCGRRGHFIETWRR